MLHVLCQMSAAFAERRSLPPTGFFLMLGTVGWRVSLEFDLMTSLQPCVDALAARRCCPIDPIDVLAAPLTDARVLFTGITGVHSTHIQGMLDPPSALELRSRQKSGALTGCLLRGCGICLHGVCALYPKYNGGLTVSCGGLQAVKCE